MAMIKCPECKQNISDRANFCPHCGVPFVENKEIPVTKYNLHTGRLTDNSGFAMFLYIIGIIILIGGLIISCSSANQLVFDSYGREYGNRFSVSLFFTTFIPYVFYSILSFGIGSLIKKFSDIHDVLCGLKLESLTESISDKKIPIERIEQEEKDKAIYQEALRQKN